MSCGFPLPSITIPIPKPELPALPKLPSIPDFSWAVDLGLSITAPSITIPIPRPELPALPKLPSLPEMPCPFEEAA